MLDPDRSRRASHFQGVQERALFKSPLSARLYGGKRRWTGLFDVERQRLEHRSLPIATPNVSSVRTTARQTSLIETLASRRERNHRRGTTDVKNKMNPT
jgi:hypothetical protein